MRQCNELYRQLAALGRKFGAARIVLFGSRARGDNREHSDIDIAVYGLPEPAWSDFEDAVDALPTLLNFDLIDMNRPISEELRANIERDGIDLMTKFNEKYAKYCLAVDRLEEAISEYESNPSDIIRDGIIQRFEFCTELAWKTTREYLLEEGAEFRNTPKAVMREAYAAGLISEDSLWSKLLTDRNLTSHTYNEDTAQEIFGCICTDYRRLLRRLADKLKETNPTA